MRNADLFRTLSGCRFYRTYFEAGRAASREAGPTRASPAARPSSEVLALRIARNRIFKKYAVILSAMVLGSLIVVVAPMWLAYEPFGRACLLSLPPMLVCAASWMAGAWWGSDRHPHVLLAVTLGLIPVRVLMVLGWAWLALAIPGMPVEAFFLALMFHWILFACAEVGMMIELSHLGAHSAQDGRQRPSAAVPAQYRLDTFHPENGASADSARHDLVQVAPADRRDLAASVR